MPEENDWVLYAAWEDKSMIRNILGYQIFDISKQLVNQRIISEHINIITNINPIIIGTNHIVVPSSWITFESYPLINYWSAHSG